MCIAGALGIRGSTPQRTPSRNCFVSKKIGLSITVWGYYVQYGKNLIDLRVNLPKFPRMPFCISCLHAGKMALTIKLFTHTVV